MTDTPATELSLSQLVSAAGLSTVTRQDHAAKVPGQVADMISATGGQLDAVEAQIVSLQELADRVRAAHAQKLEERDRLKQVLGGLYDAHAAMAKP